MTQEGFKRKLTAILSADVVGYSRLMGEDEAATVQTITAYRETMTRLIQQYRGRVVDSPGDNLLAEFASMVDATECAVKIQEELTIRNAELPEERRMQFRIGINLGDVIEEGERIYGDGVNIAARIEGLAEGGGICISGSAYEQIENKLALRYEYLGEHAVKNISKPVRVYRVPMESRAAPEVSKQKRAGLRRWKGSVLALVVVLAVGAGALAVWNPDFREYCPRWLIVMMDRIGITPMEKPSIAVLPFDNLSGDPEQEYFSDGITEEVITALSKVPELFVIARHSTFTYKGKPVNVQQVSHELGVRYVLEGSIRKAGDRLRITAQLIDATTGHHLWAERYDRDLKDIFALQDEMTMKIVTALRVKLTEGEQARLYDKSTDNLDSFMKVLEGDPYFFRFNEESNIKARQMFEEALALDPENATACTMLAWTYLMEARNSWSKSPGRSMEQAVELAQKALALKDTLDATHSLLGRIYLDKRQYEKAIAEAERAVALNPNGADAHAHLGVTLDYVGRREEAIALLKKAIRINPIPPNWYLLSLGQSYSFTGQYEEAIAIYKTVLQRNPDDFSALIGLAAAYSVSGREEKARAAAAEVLSIKPKFSLERFAETIMYKNQADTERAIEALRKAGLPD
jgi:adenylate cyclase